MKRLSYFFSLLFLMTLVVFSACKDDEVAETLEEQQTRLLTSGAFTIDAVALAGGTDSGYESGSSTIDFKANNAFTVGGNTNLPELANSDIPFPSTGTWAWKDTQNFDEVTLTAGTETVDLTITTLTDNSLVFSYSGSPQKPTEVTEVTVTASR